MKNLIFLSLTLVLTLILSCSTGESIFAPVEESEEEPVPMLVAPSYGGMANVSEDLIEQNVEGGTIVTYRNVASTNYNRFGAYLGEKGFFVTGQEEQGSKIAYAVSDGQVSFVMIYDRETLTMQLIYPPGTGYEKALAPGYEPLTIGEELSVSGLGRFTAKDFWLNTKSSLTGMVWQAMGEKYYFDAEGNELFKGVDPITKSVHTYFGFTLFNSTHEALPFSANRNNILTMTLHYVIDQTEYTYEQSDAARWSSNIKLFLDGYNKTYDNDYYMAYPIESMTEGYRYAIFNLPAGVRESTDGTLYVTIEFRTGDRCMILLRKNGVDEYADAASE